MAKNIIDRFYYSSRWCKLLILLTVVIICFIIYKKTPVLREGFIQQEKFISKKGVKIDQTFFTSNNREKVKCRGIRYLSSYDHGGKTKVSKFNI